MEENEKKWLGTWPAQCDCCHSKLDTHTFFVDGRTKSGPWALMCPVCHDRFGKGLGLGRGQRYSSETLEKMEG